MQGFFLESPWMLGICGVVLFAAAVLVWTQTGMRAALFAALAVAALSLGLLFVSLRVQTDRELIAQTIDDAAHALKQNNWERVASFIDPGATEVVTRAKNELPQYQFSEARVTRIKSIAVNSHTRPPTAVAEFNVFVALERQGQEFKVPRFVKIYFMQKGGRWLVRDYEHFEPTAGFRDTPP
ncbi:MAG: hypothetical protein KDA45_06255 [Planctomycetales bacterium]|nr:hypothetical protein [Planctomycetales bacterium]